MSMKGKFNVYLLLPFGEKFIFAIVARSTTYSRLQKLLLKKAQKQLSNPFEMIKTLHFVSAYGFCNLVPCSEAKPTIPAR